MKSKIILGVLAAASLFSTSCSDYLTEDPKGKMYAGDGYASLETLDGALIAMYSKVNRSQIFTNMQYPQWQGDDISANWKSNKQACYEIDAFAATAGNKGVGESWACHYGIIKAANQIIANIEKTGDGVSKEEKDIALGNALFWRAYSYYYLVRIFGPLPLVTVDDPSKSDIPLTDEVGIYAQIEADLKRADELNLPTSYSKAPRHLFGVDVYVTQQAVKSTLSAVYMSMAGYPLNKGVEYYKLAAEKAKEVIDGKNSGKYDIVMDADWKNVYSMGNNYNKETILGINFSPIADWATDSELSSCNMFESQTGWGDAFGEIKFWADYPDGPRKRAVYNPQILLKDGTTLVNWWDSRIPERHPMFSIFTVNRDDAGNAIAAPYDYTKPFWEGMCNDHRHRLIRYPEVLLWYAESAARAGLDLSLAKQCLKEVRARAVDGNYENVNGKAIDAMSASELAEAAYDEHGWEIAGYWVALVTRRSDQFRMDRLKDHFEWRKKLSTTPMTIESIPGQQFVDSAKVEGTWSPDRAYLPYPDTETMKNPNLKR